MERVNRDDGMASQTLCQLRDYWLTARGTRAMPAREDIEPTDVPRLLRHIVLTDVSHDPLTFRYRLIGTFVTELAGRDVTGRTLDERLYGKRTDDILWAYRQCISRRAPLAVRERVQFSDRDWVTVEALMLPLGADDRRIDMVLSGVDIIPDNGDVPPDGVSYVIKWDADLG